MSYKMGLCAILAGLALAFAVEEQGVAEPPHGEPLQLVVRDGDAARGQDRCAAEASRYSEPIECRVEPR
jgi:hypothetical protein